MLGSVYQTRYQIYLPSSFEFAQQPLVRTNLLTNPAEHRGACLAGASRGVGNSSRVTQRAFASLPIAACVLSLAQSLVRWLKPSATWLEWSHGPGLTHDSPQPLRAMLVPLHVLLEELSEMMQAERPAPTRHWLPSPWTVLWTLGPEGARVVGWICNNPGGWTPSLEFLTWPVWDGACCCC